jgi:hypothetical protein
MIPTNTPPASHVVRSRVASRRQFLACGAAAVTTTLAWPTAVFAMPRRFVMKELSLNDVCLATFAGQLHTTFGVTDAPAGRMDLKLIEASPIKTSSRRQADAPDTHYEKFSLIFSGPTTPLLEQQIYRFEHPQIGWFAMFIVPIVTKAADQQHYQAVFNRPVPIGNTSNT